MVYRSFSGAGLEWWLSGAPKTAADEELITCVCHLLCQQQTGSRRAVHVDVRRHHCHCQQRIPVGSPRSAHMCEGVDRPGSMMCASYVTTVGAVLSGALPTPCSHIVFRK